MTVTIISLNGKEFEGVAKALTVQTTSGEITILDNHRPLMTMLKQGRATVADITGAKREISIGGGFLEVVNNAVTALID
jgi:F-type H+-transporting ATPase subunit epsilon